MSKASFEMKKIGTLSKNDQKYKNKELDAKRIWNNSMTFFFLNTIYATYPREYVVARILLCCLYTRLFSIVL